VIADGLNLPTSLEIVRDTAYVVSLTGDVWKIDGVSKVSSGHRRHDGDCGRW
jgi:hypothetical protein